MQQTPERERPSRAVPKAAQRKRNNDRRALPKQARPIPAQRYINIIPKKRAERTMPASPEFLDRCRMIRSAKVFRNPDVEKARYARSDVAVPAKVVIELKCVSRCPDPRCSHIQRLARIESARHQWRQQIRDQHFFRQANHNQHQPSRQITRQHTMPHAAFKLRHHHLVPENRARQQMREKSDEQRIIANVVGPIFPLIRINQISNLRKCEK